MNEVSKIDVVVSIVLVTKTVTSSVTKTVTSLVTVMVSARFGARGARVMVGMMKSAMVEWTRLSGSRYRTLLDFPQRREKWC